MSGWNLSLSTMNPNGWMTSAEHDRKAGVITIVDRATSCTCPLVKQGLTPAAQCECTLGWQEETYSRILGRPVKTSGVRMTWAAEIASLPFG